MLAFLVAVAAHEEVAEVVLDLPGGERVCVGEEDLARSQPALDGLRVAPEHRKRGELADLRGGGVVRLAQRLEERGGGVEVRDRLLHPPADERRAGIAPVDERPGLGGSVERRERA